MQNLGEGAKRRQMGRLGVRKGSGFLGWHSQESWEGREGRESSLLLGKSGATNQRTSYADWISPFSGCWCAIGAQSQCIVEYPIFPYRVLPEGLLGS